MTFSPNTTLAYIIGKMRRLSGNPNSAQLTDQRCVDYINSAYLYDLPAEFRSLKLKDKYTFNTVQGQDTYPFDSEHYTTVEMPCYCGKREIQLFNDLWSFWGGWFNWQNQQNFATSDGSSGPFTGTTQAVPIVKSSNTLPNTSTYPASLSQNLLITANSATGTYNITDDGNGNLFEVPTSVTYPNAAPTNRGTINYVTGAISVSFPGAIPSGNPIQIQYSSQQQTIPQAILFFQNQLVLRPIPDQGYTIELVTYRQPAQAFNAQIGTGRAELNEWWELLSAMAAKKFAEDSMDSDLMMFLDKLIQERYQVAYTRTYAQLGKQRIGTIYSGQLSQGGGSGGWGFGSGNF